MANSKPDIGSYVLATKWSDGDPRDQWAVGFLAGITDHSQPRFVVVGSDGTPFRLNGFRRAKTITQQQGEAILSMRDDIEQGRKSLWGILRDLGEEDGND